MLASRSNNFYLMSTKTSRSTVSAPERISDQLMAEAFCRSRSLRQSLAAVPKFSPSLTHTRLTSPRSSSHLLVLCRAAAPAIICSRQATSKCTLVASSSHRWKCKTCTTIRILTCSLALFQCSNRTSTPSCPCLLRHRSRLRSTRAIRSSRRTESSDQASRQ